MKRPCLFLIQTLALVALGTSALHAQDGHESPSASRSRASSADTDNSGQTGQPTQEPFVPALDPVKELAPHNLLFLQKRWADAERGYADYLTQFPEGIAEREEARYKRAECLKQLGKTEGALAEIAALLKEFPDGPYRPFALMRKGEILLAKNQADSALALFKEVLKLTHSQGLKLNATFSSVLALQKLGRAAEAEPLLKTLAAVSQDNPYLAYAQLALGRMAEGRGELEEAATQYRQAFALSSTAEMRGESGVRAGVMALRLQQAREAAAQFESVRRLDVPDTWKQQATLGLLRARFAGQDWPGINALLAEKPSFPAGSGEETLYYSANAERLTGQATALDRYDALLKGAVSERYAEPASYERLLLLADKNDERFAPASAEYLKSYSNAVHLSTVTYLRGSYFFTRAQYTEAVPALESTVESGQPATAQEQALFRLAWSHYATAQYESAAKRYAQLLEKFPETLSAAEAYWQLGLAREQSGNTEGAMEAWAVLNKKFPRSTQAEQGLFRLALLQGKAGKLDEARDSFSDFLDRFPKSASCVQARFWRGSAAFDAKDYAKAMPDLEAARKADSTLFAPATERLLYAAQQIGSPDKTAGYLQEWDELLSRDAAAGKAPDDALVFWLGRQYETNAWKKAVVYYERLINAGDKVAPELRGGALARGGTAYLAVKDYTSAAATFRTLLKEKPEIGKNVVVLNQLGAACNGAQEYQEAMSLAEKAMALDAQGENNMRARMVLADAFAGMKQYVDAAKNYRTVALLFDDAEIVPLALKQAAEMYRMNNQPEEAAKAEKELKERFPSTK